MHIPFLRVSTKAQDTDRQLANITTRAQHEGWTLAPAISEVVSGAKKRADRPGLQALLKTARRGDTVVVTEISRLGRRTSEVLHTLEELSERGVSVLALNYNLATLTPDGKPNPMAQMLFTFLAEFARMERETIRERVQSGVNHARTQGRIGGRPTSAVKPAAQLETDYPTVVAKLLAGLSMRDVAQLAGVSLATVQKVAKHLVATGKLTERKKGRQPIKKVSTEVLSDEKLR